MIHITVMFTQMVRQPQPTKRHKKRRFVDCLLADSASCRLVAKYRHRCGHRHLSNQVNSGAAPEAPPTKHSKESVLNGGFQRVTHRAGGKKDSPVGMGISPYCWLCLRRHPCHQCELFGTWKILFRRCEHSNTNCNSHGTLLC